MNSLINFKNIKKMAAYKQKTLVDGYLYCMTSSWMPVNTFKIGLTENLSNRLGQYATYHINPRFVITCPPLQNPTESFSKGKNEPTKHLDLVYYREDVVHKMLQHYRCVSNREFFECSLEQVKEAFQKVETMTEVECLAYLSDIKLESKSEIEKLKEKIIFIEKCLELERSQTKKLEDELEALQTKYDSHIVYCSSKGTNLEIKRSKEELEKYKKELELYKKDIQELSQRKIEEDIKHKKEIETLKKIIKDLEIKKEEPILLKKQSFSVLFYLTPKKDYLCPNKNKCEEVFDSLFKHSSLVHKFNCTVESVNGERKVFINALIEYKSSNDVLKEVKKCCQELQKVGNECWNVFGATFTFFERDINLK